MPSEEHCSSSNIEFNAAGQEAIAHIVENDLVLNALEQRMKDYNNLTVHYEDKIQDCDLSSTHPRITLNNGQVLDTELVIGADGANSVVRKAMNVGYTSKDYQQMGGEGLFYKLQYIPGKGNGLVATRDIEPSELLGMSMLFLIVKLHKIQFAY